jgi:hypothetical protein
VEVNPQQQKNNWSGQENFYTTEKSEDTGLWKEMSVITVIKAVDKNIVVGKKGGKGGGKAVGVAPPPPLQKVY